MTFLANENLPNPGIAYLRNCGLEVLSVQEMFPRATDPEIIDIAREANLGILTMDKDYGELVFKTKVNDPPAIVFFRFPQDISPDVPGLAFESLLRNGTIIEGRFTVIDDRSFRQRPYENRC